MNEFKDFFFFIFLIIVSVLVYKESSREYNIQTHGNLVDTEIQDT